MTEEQPSSAIPAAPKRSYFGMIVLILVLVSGLLNAAALIEVYYLISHNMSVHQAVIYPPLMLLNIIFGLIIAFCTTRHRRDIEQGKRVILRFPTFVGPVSSFVLFGLAFCMLFICPFGCARDKARQSACLNNIKQISLATLMYAEENNNHFPDARRWTEQIKPYLPYPESQKLLHCPADQEKEHISYAMNEALSNLSLEKIANPTELILVFETSLKDLSPHGGLAAVVKPARHNGGNNCGYADGHAKWKRWDPAEGIQPQLNREQFDPANSQEQ